MENIIIPAVLIGFVSSIVTEIFKFIPWLAKTDLRKQITSFVITFGFIWIYFLGQNVEGKDFLGILILALTASYGTFKTILKGLVGMVGLSKRFGEK